MAGPIERALAAALSGPACDIGEIRIAAADGAFLLLHRADVERADLQLHHSAEGALALARFDDAGKFRPLKTAPNLTRGWQLRVNSIEQVRLALDYFYPGRLAVWAAKQQGRLVATPLRETLERQTGMYRVAAKISDAQIDEVVGNLCPSDGGCLRTVLWKRDRAGQVPSSKLPDKKYDEQYDQAQGLLPNDVSVGPGSIPLLCPEACTLLVGECRKKVLSIK